MCRHGKTKGARISLRAWQNKMTCKLLAKKILFKARKKIYTTDSVSQNTSTERYTLHGRTPARPVFSRFWSFIKGIVLCYSGV